MNAVSVSVLTIVLLLFIFRYGQISKDCGVKLCKSFMGNDKDKVDTQAGLQQASIYEVEMIPRPVQDSNVKNQPNNLRLLWQCDTSQPGTAKCSDEKNTFEFATPLWQGSVAQTPTDLFKSNAISRFGSVI